ncbi:hypothetical protein [Achromobacter aloeverae]
MALDDATSAAPGRTPSLLAGRSDAGARDSQSSRILAALEGRAPQPERQHMPAARARSSRAWWLLVLLLLIGAGGGAAWWRIQQQGKAAPAPGGSIMANAGAQGGGAANGAANPGQAAAPGSGATANASAASTPAPAASGPAASANGPGGANGAAAQAQPPAPAPAAIVDAPGSNREATADAAPGARGEREDSPPSNPLSALAAAAPAAALPAAPAEKGKAPDGKAAEGKADAKSAPHAARNTKARKKSDGDAALLSALMAYGLPPPSTGAVATLPGTPLAERLQQCRRKPFLESEQCRLQVCAGQWGLAPECPNPQAQTQAPARP